MTSSLFDIANLFVYGGLLGIVAFSFLYAGRSRWWRYPEGQALLAFSGTLTLITFQVAATLIWGPSWPGRNIFRLIVYALFFVASWYFVVVLVRRQHHETVERDKLLDEWAEARAREAGDLEKKKPDVPAPTINGVEPEIELTVKVRQPVWAKIRTLLGRE